MLPVLMYYNERYVQKWYTCVYIVQRAIKFCVLIKQLILV